MKKTLLAICLCLLTFICKSQYLKPQPYGKVTIADLEMKTCDFEKDANAEVLFDKGFTYFDSDFNIITEVHRRIKIFNDNGKGAADIHIPYDGGNRLENVSNVQAETINLVDGKIEITKLDKKLIYFKSIDKVRSEVVFTFSNVKPGSIIEYKYTWFTTSLSNLPDWDFQGKLPVRYSEIATEIPDMLYYRAHPSINTPYVTDSTATASRSYRSGDAVVAYNLDYEKRALANIPSLPNEPYMSSDNDYLQCLLFQLISIRPVNGFTRTGSDTWAKVGGNLIDAEDFGSQLKKRLNQEDVILNKAKTLKTNEEKIAYIFNTVKTTMKWNGIDRWYTNDGTPKAWENKTGNSAEINLILYHLLKQAGVDVYPMVVSTREHGKVKAFYTSLVQFNRAVVYAPIDSSHRYVLDATGKYNLYNQTPAELLNSSGLFIDKARNIYDIVFIKNDAPSKQIVFINAEIKAGGKLEGTAQISSSGYNKIKSTEKYKTDGESKYIDYLRDGDNGLKISSLKFDNMEEDTLPLVQNIAFNLETAGSDENYIYLNPNIFTSLKTNPFLSESRMTDVNFGYLRSYNINGIYKMPVGYKVDALPKNTAIIMPDKSIFFRRIVVEQEGTIVVRYTIEYRKPIYSKADYGDMHDFLKKMHEFLNEQIVLKKA